MCRDASYDSKKVFFGNQKKIFKDVSFNFKSCISLKEKLLKYLWLCLSIGKCAFIMQWFIEIVKMGKNVVYSFCCNIYFILCNLNLSNFK